MSEYKKPVFVVGMPRSGTTLIQGILCNTGKYFPMPETHFFVRAAYDVTEKKLSEKDRDRIRHKLLNKSRIKLDKRLPQHLTTKKDIFEHVVDQFNPAGTRTFLEKTPRHIFFYSKILEYYPDARFICMIREPKNVISSQLTNSPKSNKSVIRLALLYNKIAASIAKVRNNENTFLIKYENLTTETQIIIKDICKFLNLEFDPNLVENVAAPPGIVSEHEFWKNKNVKLKTIQKNNPAKWEEFLDNNQKNLINFITGSHAAEFGYILKYKRNAVYKGFTCDFKNLISAGEFKKIFSKIHG
jgi:hypothetical protein